MAVAVDDDTLKAVVAMWGTDHATLAALFPRPVQGGRLKSTRETPQQLPYAHVASEFASAERDTAVTLDRRKVTITVRGTYEQARDGLAAVLAVFNRNLGRDADHPPLTYPSGARFVSWIPANNEGTLKLEETTREGLDVWQGVVEATVTSVRTP